MFNTSEAEKRSNGIKKFLAANRDRLQYHYDRMQYKQSDVRFDEYVEMEFDVRGTELAGKYFVDVQ